MSLHYNAAILEKGDILMKESVSINYFPWFIVCFVMVFSSCNIEKLLGEPPEGALISPASMRPGDTYEFEMEATDPDGDSLTYSWSVGTDIYNILGEPVPDLGRFSSTTRRVVSYTAPRNTLVHTMFFVRVMVSDGVYELPYSDIYLFRDSVWKKL